jgi:hypothetical protein
MNHLMVIDQAEEGIKDNHRKFRPPQSRDKTSLFFIIKIISRYLLVKINSHPLRIQDIDDKHK